MNHYLLYKAVIIWALIQVPAPAKQNAEKQTPWPGAVIDRPARAKVVRPDTTTIRPLI